MGAISQNAYGSMFTERVTNQKVCKPNGIMEKRDFITVGRDKTIVEVHVYFRKRRAEIYLDESIKMIRQENIFPIVYPT